MRTPMKLTQYALPNKAIQLCSVYCIQLQMTWFFVVLHIFWFNSLSIVHAIRVSIKANMYEKNNTN